MVSNFHVPFRLEFERVRVVTRGCVVRGLIEEEEEDSAEFTVLRSTFDYSSGGNSVVREEGYRDKVCKAFKGIVELQLLGIIATTMRHQLFNMPCDLQNAVIVCVT